MINSIWMAFRNAFNFPLRTRVRWRKPKKIKNQPKIDLFAYLPEEERAQGEKIEARLLKDYHLEAFRQDSTIENYRETLYYAEMLEQALTTAKPNLPGNVHIADIGPSHWFYIQGMHAVFRWWQAPAGRQLTITGFEVDAYRVYLDLSARIDHALAHIRSLKGVTYRPEAFAAKPSSWDVITMLFPFVFKKDHLQWGLLQKAFDPQRLLNEAWASLKEGGLLVIANQGAEEHAAEKQMLEAAGIREYETIRFSSPLFRYDLDRYLITAVKHG